jgi:hypothetical protein
VAGPRILRGLTTEVGTPLKVLSRFFIEVLVTKSEPQNGTYRPCVLSREDKKVDISPMSSLGGGRVKHFQGPCVTSCL